VRGLCAVLHRPRAVHSPSRADPLILGLECRPLPERSCAILSSSHHSACLLLLLLATSGEMRHNSPDVARKFASYGNDRHAIADNHSDKSPNLAAASGKRACEVVSLLLLCYCTWERMSELCSTKPSRSIFENCARGRASRRNR